MIVPEPDGESLPVEETWNTFVRSVGGAVVSDLIGTSPSFQNADYYFQDSNVIVELKELRSELTSAPAYWNSFDILMKKVVAEDPSWKPPLFGGTGFPSWFLPEFLKLSRPVIARILEKANRQIRETKRHFGIDTRTGILAFVSDGTAGVTPDVILALASDLLLHRYSSIDCFLLLTLNRYVEVPHSPAEHLLWSPIYSERAQESMVNFVNELGEKWFQFLEPILGPWTTSIKTPDARILRGVKAIRR